MARLIDQGSRLSAVRLAQNHTVAEILNLNAFNEDDLYKTLDWLYEHKEKIEKANRYLYEHKRAKIATQIRHIKMYIVKLKLDGLLDVEADEGKNQLKLNVDKEALCSAEELDGCYALKTDLPKEVASKEIIHDRYKGLSEVEWAFRTQKTGYLQVRPIYVRKRERSIAHLLIVMLAYKIERYLRSVWPVCPCPQAGGDRQGGFRYHRKGRHKPIGQDNEQCDSRWREEACYRSKTRQGL